jgi:hypothetical protein
MHSYQLELIIYKGLGHLLDVQLFCLNKQQQKSLM